MPPLSATSKQSASKLRAVTERMKRKRARKNKKRALKLVITNSTQSRLLSLPGELRNKIYEYAIGGHEVRPVYLRDGNMLVELYEPYTDKLVKSNVKWTRLTDLSRICVQMRNEMELLPYKLNTFQIGYDDDFSKFLSHISPRKRECIGTVIFGFKKYYELPDDVADPFELPANLDDCKSLNNVVIRVTSSKIHKKLVTDYAKARGLEIMDESEYWERDDKQEEPENADEL